MGITINGAVNAWDNKQWNVLYEGRDAPQYPQILGTIVKATDDTLYYSGRILSQYTEANAPDPSLVGMFVNYDPDSTNPDQQIPSHVIADEWVNGLLGLDITSATTTTDTFNTINVAPLGAIGTTLYYNTLTANNTVGVIAGFNAYYIVNTLNNILLNGAACPIVTIQGVQG